MYCRLAARAFKLLNYQNIYFDKSYGFCSGCKNILRGSKKSLRLVWKVLNSQNYQNTYLDKSYGFYTCMKTHVVRLQNRP
jgi:hypothetical protein